MKKLKCLKCKEQKAETGNNFYINVNELISSERFPWCKTCITKYLGNKNESDYIDKVKTMLSLMNRPLINELWDEFNGEWSKYIRTISSLSHYSSSTFLHSDFINSSQAVYDDEIIFEDVSGFLEESKSTEELIQIWGRGFTTDELWFLQNEYSKLTNSYKCNTYAMQLIFQEIAHLRLIINKKRQKNEQTDKELKTLQDLLGSANIKPVQETGANAAEQSTFGTLIQKWENERPIPEPDKAWRDVDKIKKYVSTWFFGQLTKMLGMKGDHTEEFEEELKKYTVKPPINGEDGDSE